MIRPNTKLFISSFYTIIIVDRLRDDNGTQGRAYQWEFETGGSVRSSPTVVDGDVYIGSDDSKLYALDAGINGSSEGSRAALELLGYHDSTHSGLETNGVSTQLTESSKPSPSEDADPDSNSEESPTYCPVCGKRIEGHETVNYCPECGESM